MGNLGPILDVSSTAARLKQTEKWVRKQIERQRIPYVRIGKRVFIPEAALEQYLATLPGVSVAQALENVGGLGASA